MTGPKLAPLRVLDLGRGMASALAAKMMRDLGASVTRVEPVTGDPFYDVYPAYRAWHEGSERASLGDVDRLLGEVDVLICGGEDYPEYQPLTYDDATAAANARLVTLHLGGLLPRDGEQPVPTVDLLVQARSGFVNEQFTDRPIHFSFGGPSYGSAIVGMIGVWAALIERQRSNTGQTIEVTMEQGQALFWPQIWMTAEHSTDSFENFSPRDVRHLIFETQDHKFVHFTMGVPGAVAKLYGILGIDSEVDPNDRGGMSMARGVRNFFGDRDLIEPAVSKWKRDELLQALWDVGMTVEAVKRPGECIDDEQVAANGFLRRSESGERVIASPIRVEVKCLVDSDLLPSAPSWPSTRPLEGVRIVDLGNFVAGPYGSRLLSELGADVVKIEPLTGLQHLTGLRNVWVSNRGKRSICIDAKHPQGAEIIRRLMADADISHHNFRAGVATRLGVDPESLRAYNQDIVTLETMSYGSKGPKAHLPGFDMGMQALSGHEVRAGGRGNIPLWYRSPFLDYGTGGLGAIAMLAGLYARNQTGCAVELESSLLATGLYFLSEMVVSDAGAVSGVQPLNHEMTGYFAWERLYRVADGWIAVAARSDAMADRFANCLGFGASLGLRRTWDDATGDKIAAKLIEFQKSEILMSLREADVWSVACAGDAWPQLREDAAARAAGLVVEVPDPLYGTVTGIGRLMTFSRSTAEPAATAPLHAPTPGQHTREILAELAYSPETIAAFYADRVVA